MPLARLGLVAPTYAIKRLVEIAGLTLARDLLLTAAVLDGAAAAHAGLLTRLVANDAVTLLSIRLPPRLLRSRRFRFAR